MREIGRSKDLANTWDGLFPPGTETWLDVLHHRAATSGASIALSFLETGEVTGPRSDLTYHALERRARSIAATLKQQGVRPGDRLLLVYPTGTEFVCAFFGCLFAGAVPVPVSPPAPSRFEQSMTALAAIVRDAGVLHVLSSAAIHSLVGQLDHPLLQQSNRWQVTDTMADEMADEWSAPPVTATTLALLQYTSGSTGRPKGVMLSHANLMSSQAAIRAAFEHDSASTVVGWLPLFHDMGLIGNVLQALWNGARCVLISPIDFLQSPQRWLAAISHFGAVSSGGPSFAYELCARRIGRNNLESIDLSSWRNAFCGAEPVRVAALDQFQQRFAACGFRREAFLPCYGLAEATLLVTGVQSSHTPKVLNISRQALADNQVIVNESSAVDCIRQISCGPPWGQEVRIVEPESCKCTPEGQVGEIWVAGPNVSGGYWEKTQANEESFAGWIAESGEGPFLRTGDLGFLHEGELYITGRRKELLIIAGKNHYPQDLEDTLEDAGNSLPEIRGGGVVAFSVGIEEKDELVILAECRSTGQRSQEDIAQTIGGLLLEQHGISPREIVLLEARSLPRTTSGKKSRSACRQLFLRGELPAGAFFWRHGQIVVPSAEGAPTDAKLLGQWLVARVADASQIAPAGIRFDTPWSQLGLNSRIMVELTGELGEYLNRRLPPTLLFDHPTIERLCAYLCPSTDSGPDDESRSIEHQADDPLTEMVAVVGMACRFPGAENLDSYWQLLCNDVEAVGVPPVGRWDETELEYLGRADSPGKGRGGFIRDPFGFDPVFFGISAREAQQMDPQQRLFLEVVWEALFDAGLEGVAKDGVSTGVFAGVAAAEYGVSNLFARGPEALDAYSVTGALPSAVSGRVASLLGSEAPCLTVDTACSSSLVAIHLACQSLKLGECDLAVAGGVNLLLAPQPTVALQQTGALSPRGQCSPFDAAADGYVRGEGCGAVVLARLSDAHARGDRVYAVIRGSAMGHDGESSGFTAPNGRSQQAVIKRALRAARLQAAELEAIEAHGTGTPLGDAVELNALQAVFAAPPLRTDRLRVGSVKGHIGHLEAAAGIAGFIRMALSLVHGECPGLAHFSEPHADLADLLPALHLSANATPWLPNDRLRRGGVSSFGLTGTSAHVVLEEVLPAALSDTAIMDEKPQEELLLLSASSAPALEARISQLSDWLTTPEAGKLPVGHICFTATVRQRHRPFRAFAVGTTHAELSAALRETPILAAEQGSVQGQPLRVAFVFSGQGSQWPGMGRDLLDDEPVFRRAMEASDALSRSLDGPPIIEAIRAPSESSCLVDPVVAQPAVLAVQLALLELWASWGVTPSAVIGQGVGEIAAANAAGMLTGQQAMQLVLDGSRLLQTGSTGEPQERLSAAFASVLEPFQPNDGSIALFSALTGDRVLACTLTAKHLAQGIGKSERFEAAVQRLVDKGYRLFLELGPQPVCLPAVASCLGHAPGATLATLSPERSARGSLLNALGELACWGLPVKFAPLFQDRGAVVSLPSYPWQREQYRLRTSVAPDTKEANSRSELLDSLRVAGPEAWATVAMARLATEVRAVLVLPEEIELTADSSFLDLGIDSIRALELRDRIAALVGFEPPANIAIRLPTLGVLGEELISELCERGLLGATMPAHQAQSVTVPQATAANELDEEQQLDALWDQLLQGNGAGMGARSAAIAQEMAMEIWMSVAQGETFSDLVVPLSSDSEGTPVFFIHAVSGSVSCYRELGQILAGPLNPYGVQDPAIFATNPMPNWSAEQRAQDYIDHIRAVQPDGPYLLGGYSYGGTLAFDIARQLEDLGQEVSRLFFIDCYGPGSFPEARVGTAGLLTFVFAYEDALSFDNELLRRLGEEKSIRHMASRLTDAGILPPNSESTVVRRLQVFESHIAAMQQYVGGSYRFPGRVDLIRAASVSPWLPLGGDERQLAASDYGWAGYTVQPVVVHEIDSHHFHIMRSPDIQTVADRIRAVLDI